MTAGETEQIQAKWNSWRGQTDKGEPGSYMATRKHRVLTTDEMSFGIAHTLGADSEDELLEQMVEQEQLEKDYAKQLNEPIRF